MDLDFWDCFGREKLIPNRTWSWPVAKCFRTASICTLLYVQVCVNQVWHNGLRCCFLNFIVIHIVNEVNIGGILQSELFDFAVVNLFAWMFLYVNWSQMLRLY